jgi:hypothetical protein
VYFAVRSAETNEQHMEPLFAHTIDEQHVELLPARNTLNVVRPHPQRRPPL